VKVLAQSFANILSARGLPLATVAMRSGVPRTKLESILEGDGDLDDEEIASIADELAVPVHALFVGAHLDLFPAVDFRTANASIAKFKKGTLKAIAFVEQISSTIAALDLDVEPDPTAVADAKQLTTSAAIELAAKWRTSWGISVADQLDFAGQNSANKLYVSLRSFIENMGIMVVHYSFETDEAAGIYAQVDGGPHTIVINSTNSSKARKLFTLAHEFCHVLLRAEGASNPSVLKNQTEKFCNKFAAYLLAPDALITSGLARFGYSPSAEDRFIRLFAEKLGISQEALVRRLVEMDHLTTADYTGWRSKFNGITPPGDQSDGGGGGRTDPLQTKRTKYGSMFLGLLMQAKQRGMLDEIDIYRLCGLKPKYQNQLFEAI
jgi:Zn-dependent peptidase ImmA (M78 family)